MSNPTQWQQRAIAETGGTTQNAMFEFAPVYGTTGGALTVDFNGFVTDPIDYPFSAAALKTALELLDSIGVDGVEVSGPIAGPYTVELVGGNAGQSVPAILVDGMQLDPPQEIEVEVIQQGGSTPIAALAAQYWADHSGVASDKLRFLYMKRDLIDYRLGTLADAVDTRTGQINIVEVKESQRVLNLEKMRDRVEKAINDAVGTARSGSRRSHGRVMRHKTPNGLPYGALGVNRFTGRVE